MGTAGIAWGVYSLLGRASLDPLRSTFRSFGYALPCAAALSLLTASSATLSFRGILLATVSGALASGVGYAAWYAALPHWSATGAATLQLIVPVLAAAGGALFLGETPSLQLIFAAALTLGGIGLFVSARR
jgi:drug/metabolite transporter (DMT)-like permease